MNPEEAPPSTNDCIAYDIWETYDPTDFEADCPLTAEIIPDIVRERAPLLAAEMNHTLTERDLIDIMEALGAILWNSELDESEGVF